MAFGMKTFTLSGTIADLFTVPSGKTYIIIGLSAANIDGSADVTVKLTTVDSDNSNKEATYSPDIIVPKNAAQDLLVGKLVLCSGDKLRGVASATDDVDLTVSWMEQ